MDKIRPFAVPPPIDELIPELHDAELMAAAGSTPSARNSIGRLRANYERRFETHKAAFLRQLKRDGEPSAREAAECHRQWRAYVRGIVDPLFERVRRAADIRRFVEEAEATHGVQFVANKEAHEMVPLLDLKRLALQGRVRRICYESSQSFYAKEDLQRLAVEEAELIEAKREQEAKKRKELQNRRNRDDLYRLLMRTLSHSGVLDEEVLDRVFERVQSFSSVQQAIVDDLFTSPRLPELPADAAAFVDETIREYLSNPPPAPPSCSFCGEAQEDCRYLLASRVNEGILICDCCLRSGISVVAEKERQGSEEGSKPSLWLVP